MTRAYARARECLACRLFDLRTPPRCPQCAPRCRCIDADAGPCPHPVTDPDEAPYCPACYTARVYDVETCPHDERDL